MVRRMIYAIQAGVGGPIKFGVARDPKARMAELQTGNASELRLLATVNIHSEKESLVHRHLRDCRVRGEWFWPTAKTLKVVEVMQSGECVLGHIADNDEPTMTWWDNSYHGEGYKWEREEEAARMAAGELA
jgi:hypothetical protein